MKSIHVKTHKPTEAEIAIHQAMMSPSERASLASYQMTLERQKDKPYKQRTPRK